MHVWIYDLLFSLVILNLIFLLLQINSIFNYSIKTFLRHTLTSVKTGYQYNWTKGTNPVSTIDYLYNDYIFTIFSYITAFVKYWQRNRNDFVLKILQVIKSWEIYIFHYHNSFYFTLKWTYIMQVFMIIIPSYQIIYTTSIGLEKCIIKMYCYFVII